VKTFMTKAAAPELGQSALSAFRADIPIGGRELTPPDNETLAVATLLRHATVAPNSPASRRMLRKATRIAKQVLGKRRLEQGCDLDTPGSESPLDVFRMLGERCNGHGQVHLEDHVLASVERLAVPGSLTAGRATLRRARVAWELGEMDLGEMQLKLLLRSVQGKLFDELKLRAWLTLCAIAQARGNMPAARRFALRVLRESGDRYPRIAAGARSSLGVVAAKTRDFDESLQYLWQAYGVMKGVSIDREQAFLNNISQILLDTGHAGAARAGFARLLADSPQTRTVSPLLGGYAVASAALGDPAGVAWATGEVLMLAKLRSHPREIADALLECSAAMAAVGQDARAGTLRRRSLRLSERYGFHDLIFKAQPTTLRAMPPASPLSDASEAIAARVSEMKPDRMPTRLVYAD
jgi:hypothetical protein